ncbi:MAG: SCO family protein [Anaerolineales bacterium]|nr:SCO family protein [Anaerolineales bacterium]
MKTRNALVLLTLSIVLAALLAGYTLGERPYRFRGSLIDPPAPAADFELLDQNEQPWRLSAQRGKIVLLFFGYTYCPDVCPITLTEFKRIGEALGEQAGEVRFVFITIDPQRDTPARLGAHLGRFDPGIIGLTGEPAALQAVWGAYGVYQKSQERGSAGGYLVDHTSRVYLIDASGNWRLTYPFEIGAEAITADIRHLLRSE